MKSKILFVLIILLSFSIYFKVSANELCSSKGYTIVTINGIFTNEQGAKKNRDSLEDHSPPSYNNQPLTIDYLYNPTHGKVIDALDAINQKLFERNSLNIEDSDFAQMLSDASDKVRTEKLLLVGHSQGNFYANTLYDALADEPGGVPSRSIGVYGVATPASRVAGEGKYITSDTDDVIASLVGSVVNILPPNAHIPIKENDGNGHGFSEVYLKYEGDRVISDIKSSLNKLKENDEQESGYPCISPPELTLAQRAQGALLASLDFVINSTKDAAVYMANSAYKTIAAFGSFIRNVLAIKNVPRGLSANVIESLPGDEYIPKSVKETAMETSDNPIDLSESYEDVSSEDENIAEEETVVASVSEISYPNLLPGGGGMPSSLSPSSGNSPSSDTTPPVITVSGANPVNITEGAVYEDAGATALDETDGTRPVVTSGSVDTGTIGAYTITYTAKDLSNNIRTATRTVNVLAPAPDTTPPVITVFGHNPEMVAKDSTYSDAGASALDNVDGVLSVNVLGAVNTSAIGTYTLTYSATDLSNNTATASRSVTVDNGAMLNHPNSVAVSGNYAYVISDASNSLEIIDVSNPATPVHKSFISHGAGGAALSAPKAIAISGNYAYVVSYSGNSDISFLPGALEIIDISNPTSPVHKSVLYHSQGGAGLHSPISIALSGNYAYISSYGGHNMEIIDISNPVSPTHKASVSFGLMVTPTSVSVSGNYAYITFLNIGVPSGVPGGGLRIYDVSDPALPVAKGIIDDLTDGASINNPQSVFISGNYVYITSRGANTFEIIDVSDKTMPRHMGKIENGTGGTKLYALINAFISGNYAYVVSFVGSTLEILNVSSPASPAHTGSLADGDGGSALSYPTSISVSGNYAYISSYLSNALEIVDISNPAAPKHKGKILDGEVNRADTIVSPGPNPDPAVPSIPSYTLNGVADNIIFNPSSAPLSLIINSSESVNWLSIKIEKDGSPNLYKIFFSGKNCVDGTSSCSKSWNGKLSNGDLASPGTYRIKVHVKDPDNNEYFDYLPSTITI